MDELYSAIADELAALNAIYGEDTLTVSHAPGDNEASHSATVHLQLPTTPMTLAVVLPKSYPVTEPPEILAPCVAIGSDLPKGSGNRVVTLAQQVVRETWHGDACLYEFVEELERILKNDSSFYSPDRISHVATATSSQPLEKVATPGPSAPSFTPTWFVDDAVTVHKSVFQARACAIVNAADAASAVAALRGTDGKLARATHHIWAYRAAASPTDAAAILRDYDDDGEKAAGAKVLGVLEAMGADGVLVVVSRWFGGVLLGPERFRVIARCARDVVVKGGWGKAER